MKTVIMMEFATRQNNSLLLWQVRRSPSYVFEYDCFVSYQGNFEERHYFALAIVNGFLEFRFSTGAQPVVIRFVSHLGWLRITCEFSPSFQIKSASEYKKGSENYGKKMHHLN